MDRALIYCRVSTEGQAGEDKTSLEEQLLALRNHAAANGYEVAEEIQEDVSGRRQDTEGLRRIYELAEAGAVDVVLVHKWNRLARTVERFSAIMLKMKLAGVEVVSLDGQPNDTPSGKMFNQMLAVFSEFQRDDLIATMQQGKKGRARLKGKILPNRYAPYGFIYDDGTYRVDEAKMHNVRRIFGMVADGTTFNAIKRKLEAEGLPAPAGGPYWHAGTIRGFINNDVYKPHSYDELKDLVSPEVLEGLDPDLTYGVQWWNRRRWERKGNEILSITDNDRKDWIATPVSDAGIPLSTVEAAREQIKDNVRAVRTSKRIWELHRIAYCPCGCQLSTNR